MKKLITLFAIAGMVLALAPAAQAATLTATTDLDGGTAIPTDVGSFDDSTANIAPYVYNIDDTPGDTAMNTPAAFDMDTNDLTYNYLHTDGLGVTINASSLSHGTGGTFDFSGDYNNGGVDLTIVVDGTLAARSVSTTGGNPNDALNAGNVTLIGPSGITLIGGIDASNPYNRHADGGAIVLTSSAGSIQIGGDLVTTARRDSAPGAITLTAATGINLDGGLSNRNTDGRGDPHPAITLDGGTGPVTIDGIITLEGSSRPNGDLSITNSGAITLAILDMTHVNQVSLLGSSVSIEALIADPKNYTGPRYNETDWEAADITDYISGTDFTGFWDVSSDVIYDPDNSDAGLAGLTYNIVENGGDNGYKLKPLGGTGTVLIFR
jgi:hypothetical protein